MHHICFMHTDTHIQCIYEESSFIRAALKFNSAIFDALYTIYIITWDSLRLYMYNPRIKAINFSRVLTYFYVVTYFFHCDVAWCDLHFCTELQGLGNVLYMYNLQQAYNCVKVLRYIHCLTLVFL